MLCSSKLIVLIATASLFAPAWAGGRVHVIDSIQDNLIVFEDGRKVRFSREIGVEKKGYDLTVSDLRPGWAVEVLERNEGFADRIKVVGIPAVQKFPDSRGLKDTIAVARAELGFMPVVAALEGVDVQQAIEALTTSVLKATGRFIVVDLASRDEILNEADFARSGYANVETAPRGGRMMTARYLAKVSVVDFDHANRQGNAAGAFGFQFAKNKARSRLSLELRLVDSSTGAVQTTVSTTKTFGADALQFRANLAETANALVSFTGKGGLDDLERLASAGISVAHNGFVESPIGELFAMGINNLVEKLLSANPSQAWQSVIVNVIGDGRVVLRGGQDAGLNAGAVLEILKQSDSLTDPETGEVLGSLRMPSGSVKITEVQARFSIAQVTSGSGVQRGDVCVLKGGRP